MNVLNLLIVGLGGCAGSMARYATVMSVEKRFNSIFPFGTFTVNLTGSLVLGLLLGWLAGKTSQPHEQWKLLLGTGFCGGFTTFSAFAAENMTLLDQKHVSMALLYIGLSVVAGIGAIWLGYLIARTIF